jgi:hypothetical protein
MRHVFGLLVTRVALYAQIDSNESVIQGRFHRNDFFDGTRSVVFVDGQRHDGVRKGV